MIYTVKSPTKTTEIKSVMTWWLTKRRLFKIDHYEITLLEIDNEAQSVKLMIRNTKTGTEEIVEEAV